jgi:ribosomal protein L37AE/L43A
MARDTLSGAVVFKCYCGIQVDGGPEDALIAGDILRSGGTSDMYQRLIRNAPYDRVNQQVAQADCPDCGRDYCTQVILPPNEIVVWVCRCGRSWGNGGGRANSTSPESAGPRPDTPPAVAPARSLAQASE